MTQAFKYTAFDIICAANTQVFCVRVNTVLLFGYWVSCYSLDNITILNIQTGSGQYKIKAGPKGTQEFKVSTS